MNAGTARALTAHRNTLLGRRAPQVPFDKLTDCDIQEPAGAVTVCCVPRVLYVATVDTASAGRSELSPHELELVGLKDPEAFKKDVWSMKRGDGIKGVAGSSVPMTMTRVESSAPAGKQRWGRWSGSGGADASPETVPLLREQTELLRQAVGHLKTIANK